MRRVGANATVWFVFASVAVHAVAGGGLALAPLRSAMNALAERPAARRASEPIEMTFNGPSSEEPASNDASAASSDASEPIERAVDRERERERERQRTRAPEQQRFATPEMTITRPPPVQPPIEQRQQQAVQQSAATDDRPSDARYLAERNNNVQQETIAAVRGTQEDQSNPQHAATQQRAPGQGAGAEDVHDGRRNRAGAEVTQVEQHAGGSANSAQSQQGNAASSSAQTTAGGAAAGAQGAPAQPSGQPRVFAGAEGVWGQYALTPAQRGVASANGANGGGGNGGSGGSSAAARVGIAGRGASGAIAALSPASSDYARTFGAAVEQERRDARERQTQARGENPTESWQQLRQGMENYVASVRVGNQTSLRAAASPFATYLSQMHHRIHRLFADGFLSSLDAGARDNPLNDPNLVATVEIVLQSDGRVARIGIVRTSGNTMFDVAAMNSVRRSGPFGTTPEPIRSADGKVYIHWGFYRGDRQCGTFNAEPFILSAPNASGSRERTPIIAPHAGSDR